MIFYNTDDQTIKVLDPISLTNISGRESSFQVCKNGVLLVMYTRKRGQKVLSPASLGLLCEFYLGRQRRRIVCDTGSWQSLYLVDIGDHDETLFGQVVQEVQVGTRDWQATINGSSLRQETSRSHDAGSQVERHNRKVFDGVPGNDYGQRPQPGVCLAIDDKECVDTDRHPQGIKGEVYPLQIELANQTVSLRATQPHNMNLNHLRD